MAKSALVIGVNYYRIGNCLDYCSNDAYAIRNLFEKNDDDSPNFEVTSHIAVDETNELTTEDLKEELTKLFTNKHNETVVFYFSGHGMLTPDNNGYIITSDFNRENNLGISMVELIDLANNSPARNKVIILDTCHSGYVGSTPESGTVSLIGEGVTILTAASEEQLSMETDLLEHGIFTSLLIESLQGGAANILGQVTPGAIYSYIDKSLGNLEQRPIFKTFTNSFIELRVAEPTIDVRSLRKIHIIFDNPHEELQLDQTFESDDNVPNEYIPKKPCIPENLATFRILQEYTSAGLVLPVGEKHMYYAAMNEKSCKLTNYGKHYWNLSKRKKI